MDTNSLHVVQTQYLNVTKYFAYSTDAQTQAQSTVHRHQIPLASVIAITLISTSQTSQELNYAPSSRRSFQSHIRAISHDSKCASVHIMRVAN